MSMVIEQYGRYIISVIVGAVVIYGMCALLGFFPDSNGTSGHGLLGEVICLWLNRVM